MITNTFFKRKLHSVLGILMAIPLALSACEVSANAAVIKKPLAKSRNAAEYYQGSTLYYTASTQSWKKLKHSLLYTYKGKKDTRYYRPLMYLTSTWLSNNKRDLTVHLGRTKSKSVSSVVQSTIGISSPNTSLATSASRSYSSSISTSYTTDYTFVMKNYSTRHYYKPAFFGYILKYGIIKTNNFTKRASCMSSYTYDNSAGLYLKLAWR